MGSDEIIKRQMDLQSPNHPTLVNSNNYRERNKKGEERTSVSPLLVHRITACCVAP